MPSRGKYKYTYTLRPILSMIASSQYAMSKWFTTIFQPILEWYNSSCIRNSFEFSYFIPHYQLTNLYVPMIFPSSLPVSLSQRLLIYVLTPYIIISCPLLLFLRTFFYFTPVSVFF